MLKTEVVSQQELCANQNHIELCCLQLRFNMLKRLIQRLAKARFRKASPASYSPLPTSGYRPTVRTQRAFLVLMGALLLESSLLQIATTVDGSEIAFNPPRDVQLAHLKTDVTEGESSKVAGVQAEREEASQSKKKDKSSTKPKNTQRMSLVTPANASTVSNPLDNPSVGFKQPLRSYILTQYYSSYHTAIDMAAPHGTPVYSTAPGVVANTGYLLAGGGLMVEVKHAGGYVSYYAHLSAITASPGQQVDNNSQIGLVGATGWATGAHLHFMISQNGGAINPLSVVK